MNERTDPWTDAEIDAAIRKMQASVPGAEVVLFTQAFSLLQRIAIALEELAAQGKPQPLLQSVENKPIVSDGVRV